MKNFNIKFALATSIICFFFANSLLAELMPPSWLMQTNTQRDYKITEQGDTIEVFSPVLEWDNGFKDNQTDSIGYYVFRAMYGPNQTEDDFKLVGIVDAKGNTGSKITYIDDPVYGGAFSYYVIAFQQGLTSEKSRTIIAFAPGSYCVNLNAEIIDFITFPKTVAAPGELYEYESFAKHRSFRVQGWVEYELVEGPEGLSIDKNGLVTWQIPTDASGEYYVKIRATSSEDSRAESIQEWYISIALPFELGTPASVLNYSDVNRFNVYPTPTSENINFNIEAKNSNIQIEVLDISGNILISETKNINPGTQTLDLTTSNLYTGTYILRIIDGTELHFSKFIVE